MSWLAANRNHLVYLFLLPFPLGQDSLVALFGIGLCLLRVLAEPLIPRGRFSLMAVDLICMQAVLCVMWFHMGLLAGLKASCLGHWVVCIFCVAGDIPYLLPWTQYLCAIYCTRALPWRLQMQLHWLLFVRTKLSDYIYWCALHSTSLSCLLCPAWRVRTESD